MTFTPSGFRRSTAALFATVLLAAITHGEESTLIRQLTSREVGLHVGGLQDPLVRTMATRELTLSIVSDRPDPFRRVASREFSVVLADAPAPSAVTNLTATSSPAGDRVVARWASYNQWAERDIARFDIYLSDQPFHSVTNRSPWRSVPGEHTEAELEGLPTFRDHYLAIVPVDALGNFLPDVKYLGVYVLTRSLASRELALFVDGKPPISVSSREVSVVQATPETPPRITHLAKSSSPSGNSVTLGWASYNQWAEKDVGRFDIYRSDQPFSSVAGMKPWATAPGESTSLQLDGLPEFRDHFFAVIPVDGVGNFESDVQYFGVYVLVGKLASRELGLFVGEEPSRPLRQSSSRELTVLVPNSKIPEPVTAAGGSFRVSTARTAPRALDLEWLGYNEVAQEDVVRYAIYVADSPFESVAGMTARARVADGTQGFLLTGLESARIYHVAVVAEDVLGNFNPAVRSISSITTPRLEMSVPSLTIDEQAPLKYQLTVTEADLREFALRFSLVSGPPGARVEPSGEMFWTPTEAEGPAAHRLTVQVTDNGTPPETATTEFSIQVREVNQSPALTRLTDHQLGATNTLDVQLESQDPDLPKNQVLYSLVEGPPGMTVSDSGRVQWNPPPATRPSLQQVTVRVRDDGFPSESSEATFWVSVADPLAELALTTREGSGGQPAQVELRAVTQIGFQYRFEASEVLPPIWNTFQIIPGTGATVSLMVDALDTPSRYYRVVVELPTP